MKMFTHESLGEYLRGSVLNREVDEMHFVPRNQHALRGTAVFGKVERSDYI
jgi:hypothetical protein